MKSKKRKMIIRIFIFAFSLICLSTTFYVEMQVRKTCESAKLHFQQDYLYSLIQQIQAEQSCTKLEYRSIWAIEQLGDERAIEFLRNYIEEQSQPNPCRHEAEFALKKLEKNSFNLPAFLWRWTWK